MFSVTTTGLIHLLPLFEVEGFGIDFAFSRENEQIGRDWNYGICLKMGHLITSESLSCFVDLAIGMHSYPLLEKSQQVLPFGNHIAS